MTHLFQLACSLRKRKVRQYAPRLSLSLSPSIHELLYLQTLLQWNKKIPGPQMLQGMTGKIAVNFK